MTGYRSESSVLRWAFSASQTGLAALLASGFDGSRFLEDNMFLCPPPRPRPRSTN
jgi:hypothetical protein